VAFKNLSHFKNANPKL